MTKNFNILLEKYTRMFEATDHVAEPQVDRSQIDLEYFTNELIKDMRAHQVFDDMEDYINFDRFKKTEHTLSGDVVTFSWLGYKGKYEFNIKQIDDKFIVAITCDDKLLDSPKGDNVTWDMYYKSVTEYVGEQERTAKEEHNNSDKGLQGEDAIQLTSNQPSALPNAPEVNAPAEPQPNK